MVSSFYTINIILILLSLPAFVYNIKDFFNKTYSIDYTIGDNLKKSNENHSLKYKIKFIAYFLMTLISFLGLIFTILAQFTGILVKNSDLANGIFRTFGIY
jgi:hypothetical protein